jgi:hypothetical protein
LIEADELGSTLVRVAAILLILLVFVRSAPAHAMGGLFDTNSNAPNLRHHHHHHRQTTTSGSGGNEVSSGDASGDTGSHTSGPIGDPLPDVQILPSETGLSGSGVGDPLASVDPPTASDATDVADPVPLPGTLSLLGAGLIVIALIAWLRRHRPRRKAV